MVVVWGVQTMWMMVVKGRRRGDEVKDGGGHALLGGGSVVGGNRREDFEAGRALPLYKDPCSTPPLLHLCRVDNNVITATKVAGPEGSFL